MILIPSSFPLPYWYSFFVVVIFWTALTVSIYYVAIKTVKVIESDPYVE